MWIFIAALTVRLAVLFWFYNSPFFLPDGGDMKFYNGWALKILHGEWSDHKAFYGLPGYPFFLAGIYAVVTRFATLKLAALVVGALQCMAEAATSMLIYKIAGQIFSPSPGEADDTAGAPRAQIVGALAAIGWILFQPAQTFSIIIMPTSWMILTFWWLVWYILSMRDPSPWRPWPWLGLLVGVVTMMVATLLFLMPLLLVAVFFRLKPAGAWYARLSKYLAACALLFAGVLAGIAPCALHNYLVAREPVLLSAHSGLNFFIGNNGIANGYPKIPPGLRAGQEGMLQDSILWAEKAEGRQLKRVEVSQFWSAKAHAYIHDHFGDWLKLLCVKFKNFWNAYQYDDLSLVTMFAAEGVITPGLKFGFVAALGIPGIFIAFYKYRRSRWVIAAIFLHMASLMTVFITERYRLAAAPGLLLMAAIGLWEFGMWLARKEWREAGIYAGGCAAAIFFVGLPVTDGTDLWSLDYYNTGIKDIEASDLYDQEDNRDEAQVSLVRAQEQLDTAFAYVPLNSDINFALGNLWVKKGYIAKSIGNPAATRDRDIAKAFYVRAVTINARHNSAFNNLGAMDIEDRQWDAATACLERAAAIEPGDTKTWYLLAKARLGAGDLAGADKYVKHALSIAPGQKDLQELAEEIAGRMQSP